MNLLIVGAGAYSMVAAEIAAEMSCFRTIDFVDDVRTTACNGKPVVGTTMQLPELSLCYDCIVVAIGDPIKRIALLDHISKALPFEITTLVSPKAHVSTSARIDVGSIIEPMAVVHTGCVLDRGCIISAGAVLNHFSTCGEGVHVDCNATVEGFCRIPMGMKIPAGENYRNK